MIGATQLNDARHHGRKVEGASPIPDLLVDVQVARFRPLDFGRVSAILDAGASVKDDVKRRLTVALGRRIFVEP